MAREYNFFFVAGEASGDLLGEGVLNALKKHSCKFVGKGIGGELMQKAGLLELGLFETIQVMGVQDVLLALPRLVKALHTTAKKIVEENPDACLLIDAPSFNLRLAKLVRKKGYKGKLIQYVSPSIWAWKKGRLASMEKTLDEVFVLFPFELECYQKSSLQATFVGHPLQEVLPPRVSQKQDNLLAIFPGSRRGEIEKTLPRLLQIAKATKQRAPETDIALSYQRTTLLPQLQRLVKQSGLDISFFPPEEKYHYMNLAKTALATSGTVTLELSWFHTPTVVLYELSLFDRLLARCFRLDQVPFFCLVNLLQNKEIFPEWIKKKPSPETIAEQLSSLAASNEIKIACETVWQKLSQEKAPSELAAKRLLEML